MVYLVIDTIILVSFSNKTNAEEDIEIESYLRLPVEFSELIGREAEIYRDENGFSYHSCQPREYSKRE
ncbi:MAG: hypothetical protein QW132_01495 [Archaeoglobaceae archaeon]